MTAVQFLVNEVFDIPTRGGLIAVGSTRNGDFLGIPRLRDEASGRPIHVLGVDHPTPRTQRTGETILWSTAPTPTTSPSDGYGPWKADLEGPEVPEASPLIRKLCSPPHPDRR
jgi:hypothetical protein